MAYLGCPLRKYINNLLRQLEFQNLKKKNVANEVKFLEQLFWQFCVRYVLRCITIWYGEDAFRSQLSIQS